MEGGGGDSSSVRGGNNSRESDCQFALQDPPSDQISCVRFQLNSETFLAVASWDGVVRLYDVEEGKCVLKTAKGHPYMGCFATDNWVYYGGLDGTLYKTHTLNGNSRNLGKHENSIRCIEYSEFQKILLTGSWDSTVSLWDSRTSKLIRSHRQPDEVYCMDVRDEILMVGTAGQRIAVWDLRKMKAPLSERSSQLGLYQTRALKLFPNKKMYALATIEGRVSIDSVLPNDSSVPVFAFKPHVEKPSGTGHPVNALAVHNPSSFFVTGASDRKVQLWDADRKKRISEFQAYPSPVSTMDFSADGSKLAIGCSYLHDLEVKPDPLPPSLIFIRNVVVDVSGSSSGSNASRQNVLSEQNN